jgi:hypothetical protein
MSWRTFGQAVLLILIYLIGYWALLSWRDGAAARAYEARQAAFNASVSAVSSSMADEALMGNDVATVDAVNAAVPAPDANGEIGRANFQGE